MQAESLCLQPYCMIIMKKALIIEHVERTFVCCFADQGCASFSRGSEGGLNTAYIGTLQIGSQSLSILGFG